MSSYPNSIPELIDPVASVKTGDPTQAQTHSAIHKAVNDEVEAIALELGTNPKGVSVSVKARLSTLDLTVGNKVDKVTGKALSTNDYTDGDKTKVNNLSGTNTGDQVIPDQLSDLSDDSTHRLVTDTEKSTWNAKQTALESGVNIKTINNESILGSGNITVTGGASLVKSTFTNASLSTGILTITHNLALAEGAEILMVTILNNSKKMIIPSNITFGANSFAVDLLAFGTLTGTWQIAYIA